MCAFVSANLCVLKGEIRYPTRIHLARVSVPVVHHFALWIYQAGTFTHVTFNIRTKYLDLPPLTRERVTKLLSSITTRIQIKMANEINHETVY
jgi:hypothetical protein